MIIIMARILNVAKSFDTNPRKKTINECSKLFTKPTVSIIFTIGEDGGCLRENTHSTKTFFGTKTKLILIQIICGSF